MKSVCHGVLEEALGRKVSQKEADELFGRFTRRAERLRASEPGLSYNDALARVAQQYADDADQRLAIAKRNAIYDEMRSREATDYLDNVWREDPGQGLKALLVGVQDARKGARRSVGTDAEAMANKTSGGLIADIAMVDEAALSLFSRGDLDDEVAGVLFELSYGRDINRFSQMAQGIGKAVRKWQDYARVTANEAGAWIGQVKGFITSTYHDSARIAADRDAWMQSARENFDLRRMAEDMDVDYGDMESILSGMWQDFADGVHMKLYQPPRLSRSSRNAGRELSQHREVHFRSSDSWAAYNADFGSGNLREAVMWGLRRQAQATALMNGLGPRYQENYDRLTGDMLARMKKRKDPPQRIAQFQKDIKSYRRLYLAQLDGSLDIPANDTLATVAGSIRAIQTMSSLGGSTLSSVSDLGVMMLGAKYNGLNPFQLVGRGVGQLFKGVPKPERLTLQADLGVALSSLSGKLAHGRFTPEDDVRGMIGAAQQKFFTLNLQNRWTDSMREATAELLSANLARRIGEGFDKLPERLRMTLSLYGLDAGKWDIVRQAQPGEVDGSRFLSPRDLDDLPDSAFSAYLASRELAPTAERVKDLRSEIKRELRAYFTDQNQYLLLTPDAGTLGMMKQGTQRGTGIGEAVRFMMQFKSFSLAYSQKVMGREIKQSGMLGVANMLAVSTVMGYAAMSLKDLFKRRTPRDPTDWRTFPAAFAQGGGAGLYSDVLFSQVLDRRFKDALVSLAGPTASDANALLDIAARAAQGRDASAAGVRFVQANTPMLNIFYSKITLDFLIFHRLQEWMNPGSLERMEREMEQRTGQQFIGAPPSELVQ